MSYARHKNSTLNYILKALVPYSSANIKLVFKPASFFKDLEKTSKRKTQTVRNVYYQAQKQGLIKIDKNGMPRLTDKGRAKIGPYKPKLLKGSVRLMVAFDIPEIERWKRRRLRALLKELSFKQIQKSVWTTKYDYQAYVKEEIKELSLQKYVDVYEVHKLQI